MLQQALRLFAPFVSLWSVQAAAQAISPNRPNSFSTADPINHDFTASSCGRFDIGTVLPEIENPYRRQDDVDFSNNAPGTPFVNTARWDFGTFEIATP